VGTHVSNGILRECMLALLLHVQDDPDFVYPDRGFLWYMPLPA